MKMTVAEYKEESEQSIGICLSCGYFQGEVEPDAECYTCEDCGADEVYGLEQALLIGALTIEGE